MASSSIATVVSLGWRDWVKGAARVVKIEACGMVEWEKRAGKARHGGPEGSQSSNQKDVVQPL